jgi:flagellar biosynthesis protein FlhG
VIRIDQAHDLRRLVRQAKHAAPPQASLRRLIALAGAKGGVGTTTLALNLALVLADRGHAAALVDADPDGPGVAALCRLRERAILADVLAGRRTVAESLEPGPAGLLVLPGGAISDRQAGEVPLDPQRLIQPLRTLAPAGGMAVVDSGNCAGRPADSFRRAADVVLIVTTPDSAAVLGAYAAIKRLADGRECPRVQLVVNMARTAEASNAAHARLARACRRFLGFSLDLLGHVPPDPAVPQAAEARHALVLAVPHSPAARAIRRLAGKLHDEPPAARPLHLADCDHPLLVEPSRQAPRGQLRQIVSSGLGQ